MINPYYETILIVTVINVMLGLSLNLIMGYNGLFSVGHHGYMAIGAYASAVLTLSFGFPIWAAVLVATAVTGVIALLTGLPLLNLRGDYLAIATLAFAEIVRIMWPVLPQEYFGGAIGLKDIPSVGDRIWPTAEAAELSAQSSWMVKLNGPLNLAATVLTLVLFLALAGYGVYSLYRYCLKWSNDRFGSGWQGTVAASIPVAALFAWQWSNIPEFFTGFFQFNKALTREAFASNQWAVFLVFAVVIFGFTWLVRNYLDSLYGRAIQAIREDELASENLGLNVFRYKILNFTFGSMWAGTAGALFAHYMVSINPANFNIFRIVDVLLIVVLGGMGSTTGSYFGGIIVSWLPEVLRFLGQWRLVIYALTLVSLMIFRPAGLFGHYEIGINPKQWWDDFFGGGGDDLEEAKQGA